MKLVSIKGLLIILLLFIARDIIAQPPSGINFQAVAKDAMNNPAKNRDVYIKDIIYQKSAVNGILVWEESFIAKANEDGVFTIVIGKGTKAGTIPAGIADISKIDWSNGPFFLNVKIAVAPSIPTTWWIPADNYLDAGTTQLEAAPFSFYANNATHSNVADSAGISAKLTPGQPGTFLYTDSMGNAAWTKPSFTNTYVSNVTQSIKAGQPGTFLTTDTSGNVAWTFPQAANVNVTQISNNILQLSNNIVASGANAIISPLTTTKVKVAVPGAVKGDPVLITALGDYVNFNVYSAFVSNQDEVTIRFSNFQTKPVPVLGNLYKIVIIK